MQRLKTCLLATIAFAALPAAPATDKPRTFALVAAVGEEFNLVYEEQSTGTHLAPYRRRTAHAEQNIMNRLVLHSLDKAIAGIEPQSKRLYFAIAVPDLEQTDPAARESIAIGNVRRELEKMPDRTQWDRIVVITPAYSLMSRSGLASRLHGLGVFTQPLCQSNPQSCELGMRGPSGIEADTPGGKTVQANYYVAPYSYIETWVLDPRTLEVLDKRTTYDSQKLVDPYGALDLNQSISKEFFAARIVALIDHSVQDAVRATELRGTVEVSPGKPVDARKPESK